MIQTNNKNTIREECFKAGFEQVGFAKVSDLNMETVNLTKWLTNGYNGNMNYLERNTDKRNDIRLILEDARTVIVTATNYYTTNKHNNNPDHGKVSRYAWGDDYHEVILPKLKLVADKIKEIDDKSISKCYVDTGPILEKQWAIKAGLGWQGKNSLILNKKLGSYFFIGIIITTSEFEPDKVVSDHCGSCSKCISECPTQAIIEPKVVDSTKCISYWTIETKANQKFPDEIQQNLNGWIFGCDICQEVCPWNRKLNPVDLVSFQPRNNVTELELNELSKIEEGEFKIRFQNSPLKRPKRDGIIRNAEALLLNKSIHRD